MFVSVWWCCCWVVFSLVCWLGFVGDCVWFVVCGEFSLMWLLVYVFLFWYGFEVVVCV